MLSKDDAQTIVPGLLDKRESECLKNSTSSERSEPDSITFETAKHPSGIVATAGHAGENFTSESLECRRSANPDAAIDELRGALLARNTGQEQDRLKVAEKAYGCQSWIRRSFAYLSSWLHWTTAPSLH